MTKDVVSYSSAAMAVTMAAIGSAAMMYTYHLRKTKEISENVNEQRMAERRGRIRAELRLRNAMKEAEERKISTLSNEMDEDKNGTKMTSKELKNSQKDSVSRNNDMLLRCIGTVVSPFTKRMGTPRQGALAPNSRGYIQLTPKVAPMETLSGIELYSHAWILFSFHANTDCPGSVKTKVRPPRAGGLKVGQMATRSPHRPNSIGLSLVKIAGIDEKKKRLHIAALDLVNGTPVYGKMLSFSL